MSCDWVREHLPECLAGTLERAAREMLIEHVETCARCRSELGELGVVWRGLESMTPPEPDPSLRVRFGQMLQVYQEAYQAGLEAAQSGARPAERRRWWPARPVWQLAGAFAMLVAGVVCGRYLDRRYFDTARTEGQEISLLRGQMEGLRQLVALSLLDEPSPSSRLRGVTYSEQMTQPDAQVVAALLHAVNHDSNVNVRLSAVDALQKYAGDAEVRRALVDAIEAQDSALVQIALIDLLADLHDLDAAPQLRKLARDESLDETVRQRAGQALERLGTKGSKIR